MRQFTTLAALTLLAACTAPPVSPVAAAGAQSQTGAVSPVLASLSPADLDAFISRTVADQHAIGVTVGVMQDGKVVFSKGYG